MYSKVVKYTDYNDVEREETFLFHLNKAELLELNMSTEGGLENLINTIVSTIDTPKLIALFKKIILLSYGVKSPDGKRFIKDEQLTKEFTQTEAYSIIFMELATDADVASQFINGIIPSDMREQIKAEQSKPAIEVVK